MINVFLIGTCRIHRPFGCNSVTRNPFHFNNIYNALNLLGKYSFLGYFHNIKEIKQLVDLLINNYDNPAIALILCTDNETKTLEMAIFYKEIN